MTLIQLDIDPKQFQDDLKAKIPVSGMQSLPALIIDLVVEQFNKQLRDLVTSEEILRFKIEYLRSALTSVWPPLTRLPLSLQGVTGQTTFDLGCFAVTIVTKRGNSTKIHVKTGVNLQNLQPVQVKRQCLKTVQKHIIRIRQVGLPADILFPVNNAFDTPCQCPPDCLASYIDGVWDWALRFICKVCGKSYFCECFRTALEKHYRKALAARSDYQEGGWSHKFITAYQQSEFREGICHLCRDITSELFYCHPMYGSKIMVHYGPYIVRTAIEKGIDQREAENEIREALGIPRISEGWLSEVELLNMIRDIFPTNEVVHQASPEWLGRQRFDIFIPELSLAIEYQGRQHYEPVSFFGGEEGFSRVKERDRLKAKLCTENGVTLLYFRYDEEITHKLIENRMKKPLSERH